MIAAFLVLAIPSIAFAAGLPGFHVQFLGTPSGFLTSMVFDSKGTLYYTAKGGSIYRFEDGRSTKIAQVRTAGWGDAGLLGMALIDDDTAALHYTIPKEDPELVTYDVIARMDLRTGIETVLHRFAADIDVPERGGSAEHHGGNPIVAPDGSIFVGIGEYNGYKIAWLPEWNGGKIWRVYPDGSVVQYVRGLRNPYDLVWDDARQRLIFADNGAVGGDEINIATLGANCGWPFVSGYQPYPEGTLAPVYIWKETVAPTGTLELRDGANDQLRRGIVISGYVSKRVHYVPGIDVSPLPDPIVVLDMTPAELIDVAQAPDGTIYVASGFAIWKVLTPRRGDCNGDGVIDSADLSALSSELADAPEPRIDAQNGSYRGSWGCDANGDDRIDAADWSALQQMISPRRRAVGR